MNIEVFGAVTEQFLCLVRVRLNLVVPGVGQWVCLDVEHFGMVLQVVPMQIGLGWVALWEVGLD